jgi:hypothetical protein
MPPEPVRLEPKPLSGTSLPPAQFFLDTEPTTPAQPPAAPAQPPAAPAQPPAAQAALPEADIAIEIEADSKQIRTLLDDSPMPALPEPTEEPAAVPAKKSTPAKAPAHSEDMSTAVAFMGGEAPASTEMLGSAPSFESLLTSSTSFESIEIEMLEEDTSVSPEQKQQNLSAQAEPPRAGTIPLASTGSHSSATNTGGHQRRSNTGGHQRTSNTGGHQRTSNTGAHQRASNMNDQQRAEQLFIDGRNRFKAKEVSGAARMLREAVRLDPGQLRYRLLLGHVLCSNQRWHKEAEEQFRRVLEIDPLNSMAHVGLGQLYAKVGLNRRAETEFREALRLDPDNTVAQKGLHSIRNDEPTPSSSTSFLSKIFTKK